MKGYAIIILAVAALAASCSGCKEKPKATESVVEKTDTTALIIMQLQKCSRLYTAEYDIHKIVTHSDEKRLKGKLFDHEFDVRMPLGDRKIAIPINVRLKAYVDFGSFGEENVSRKGNKIEVTLPDPRVVVTSSKVDHDEIKQYIDLTRSRFTDAEMTNFENQGREAVVKSIPQLGIINTARDNAAQVIIPMIVKMGYDEKDITVTFRKDYEWKIEKLMDIKKTILALLKQFRLQITLGIVGIVAVLALLSWLSHTVSTSSVEIVGNDSIDITPQQIQSIKAIGQWEFLAINDEVMVDTVRRGIFSDDHLTRIYYGTLRLGVDMHRTKPGWIEAHGDTIVVTLPPVGLLDEEFIDETRTKSFYESGKWDAKARKELLAKAYRKMRADCLTPKNIEIAQNNADLQMRNIMKAMGFNTVAIRFSKDNK